MIRRERYLKMVRESQQTVRQAERESLSNDRRLEELERRSQALAEQINPLLDVLAPKKEVPDKSS